jgi:hypothetical protein
MTSVNVTHEYGLIIRRAALVQRDVSLKSVLDVLKVNHPLDQDEKLISFGPSFGQEALDELIRLLIGLGLHHVDDFIEVVGDYPSWVSFRATYTNAGK